MKKLTAFMLFLILVLPKPKTATSNNVAIHYPPNVKLTFTTPADNHSCIFLPQTSFLAWGCATLGWSCTTLG